MQNIYDKLIDEILLDAGLNTCTTAKEPEPLTVEKVQEVIALCGGRKPKKLEYLPILSGIKERYWYKLRPPLFDTTTT
ncbi:MAG: hypothetical protein PVG39_00735 [Desulfobacteraceae bacterium]|jgi:hypothetical protein